jgi:hypothetical protein
MTNTTESLIVALQAFHVLFLWLHDWVPLGRLNDVAAVRAADSTRRLVRVTLIQSLPFTAVFGFTLIYLGHRWPGWLLWWLFCSYGVLFLGELRAWWIPYLVHAEPERVKRYQEMFGQTHSFLPPRNGIVPNTLHVILHAATLCTVIPLIAAIVSR